MSALLSGLRSKRQFIPGGFRDDYGVWHDGPHRFEFDVALDRLQDLYDAALAFIDTTSVARQPKLSRPAFAAFAMALAELMGDGHLDEIDEFEARATDTAGLTLCPRCLAGEPGECHTPGCAHWMTEQSSPGQAG